MRAVLFHAHSTGRPGDWNQFLGKVPGLLPPPQVEELAEGIWLLPLPDCQIFLDALTRLAQGPLPLVSSKMREVGCLAPWQTVS